MDHLPVLSLENAQRIIARIQLELERTKLGAAIAVTDAHGELIAFARTAGCPLPSIQNAINKAFTAARERTASANIGKASREEGFPMTNFGDLRYTGWGGGVPIFHGDVVIGAVGVSGLPEAEDMQLAAIGAAVLEEDA